MSIKSLRLVIYIIHVLYLFRYNTFQETEKELPYDVHATYGHANPHPCFARNYLSQL